jgi:hypothetical protein
VRIFTATPSRRRLAIRRLAPRPRRRIERGRARVDHVVRATGDDALRSSLRDQQALAAIFDDDGEAPALESNGISVILRTR